MQRVSWHGRSRTSRTGRVSGGRWRFSSHGRPDLYVLFNASADAQRFTLPPGRWWKRLVDTNLPSPDDVVEEKDAVPLRPADHYFASARSAVILIAPS